MLDVCVAGFVYFEVGVPRGATVPEPGTESFVEALPLRLGGALNTASVVRALGHASAVASPRGEGPGDLAVQQTLRALDIADFPWPSANDPAVSLVFATATDRAFLSAADAQALSSCPPLPAAKWVHVPGLLEAQRMAARLEQARAAGSLVSVSGSWSPELLESLRLRTHRAWDLLTLNEQEAKVVAPTLEESLDVLREVATDVVITLGPRGALGRLQGAEVRVEAQRVEAIDFTGAGDAFSGGLLAGLVRRLPPADALRLGVTAASRVLTQTGGVARPELFKELA